MATVEHPWSSKGGGMRAVVVERFGGPEVLVLAEVPDPVPGPDQVVVDVSVADTIFVETTIRRGEAGEHFDINPPYVPGGAVAGRVSAVGDGVDTDWIGKEVATLTGGSGGYADRVVAAVDGLVAVPDGVSLTATAALQHDGLTALALTEPAPLRPGRWVLVTAAAGGMGVLLIQLARASGARVIGAARGRRKLDLVSSVGADLAVDYSQTGWTEQVRQATGRGVDVVFDGAGGDIGHAAFDLTAPGGWFSGHGAPNGGFASCRHRPGRAQRHHGARHSTRVARPGRAASVPRQGVTPCGRRQAGAAHRPDLPIGPSRRRAPRDRDPHRARQDSAPGATARVRPNHFRRVSTV